MESTEHIQSRFGLMRCTRIFLSFARRCRLFHPAVPVRPLVSAFFVRIHEHYFVAAMVVLFNRYAIAYGFVG